MVVLHDVPTKATCLRRYISERKVASRSSSKPSDFLSNAWSRVAEGGFFVHHFLTYSITFRSFKTWKQQMEIPYQHRRLANGRLQPQSDKSRVHYLFLSHHWKRQVVRNDNLHSAGVAGWFLSISVGPLAVIVVKGSWSGSPWGCGNKMTYCLPMTALQKYWLQR